MKQIITVQETVIEDVIAGSGLEGITLYAVSEKTLRPDFDTEGKRDEDYAWDSFHAAVELNLADRDQFLALIAEAAASAGRFGDFVEAVRRMEEHDGDEVLDDENKLILIFPGVEMIASPLVDESPAPEQDEVPGDSGEAVAL